MTNKLIYFIKFVVFVFIFMFFSILQSNFTLSNIDPNYIPDLPMFILFYTFFINKSISYFGTFIVCVMYDVINLLPTGVTSLSAIIVFKLIEIIVSRTILNINKDKYIVFFIFFILYTLFRLFLMTYFYNRYHMLSIKYILLNIVYFIIFVQLMSHLHSVTKGE